MNADETQRITDALDLFRKERHLYEHKAQCLQTLLRQVLETDPRWTLAPFPGPPNIHHVEYRVKELLSLEEKLKRPGKHYTDPLLDVTDLIGLRVIGYYDGDISIISHLIESEFDIDGARSEDAADRLADNEFGYRSIHYIASLKPKRHVLPEWRDYRDLKFEIQVRTIVQHAWATLDHKLTYKAFNEAPAELTRRIARLAAILEVADAESARLQADRQQIQDRYRDKVKNGDFDFDVNIDSLATYLDETKLHDRWGVEAKRIGWTIEKLNARNPAQKGRLRQARSSLLRVLKLAKYSNISDLNGLLTSENPKYKEGLERLHAELLSRGLSLIATPIDIVRGLAINDVWGDKITAEDLSALKYDDELVEAYSAAYTIPSEESDS